jgi:ATP-dependent RNA helicase RhlE
VAAEEQELLQAIEKLIGNRLPQQAVPGFEPTVLSAPPLDLSGGRGKGRGKGAMAASGRPRRSANGNNRHTRNR